MRFLPALSSGGYTKCYLHFPLMLHKRDEMRDAWAGYRNEASFSSENRFSSPPKAKKVLAAPPYSGAVQGR